MLGQHVYFIKQNKPKFLLGTGIAR